MGSFTIYLVQFLEKLLFSGVNDLMTIKREIGDGGKKGRHTNGKDHFEKNAAEKG